MNLTNIPFNFKYVSGMFNCSDNNLETLKGSPKTNGMDFRCSKNKLKSLEFGPETILKYIDLGNERYSITCGSNSIASLKMGPALVPEYFNCEDNNIIILSDYGRNYKFKSVQDNPILINKTDVAHQVNWPDEKIRRKFQTGLYGLDNEEFSEVLDELHKGEHLNLLMSMGYDLVKIADKFKIDLLGLFTQQQIRLFKSANQTEDIIGFRF